MTTLKYIALAFGFLLIPSFAFAQTTETNAETAVTAEVASTTPPPTRPFSLPKPPLPSPRAVGEGVRNAASTTRANVEQGVRTVASTTRGAVEQRVGQAQEFMDKRRAEVEGLLMKKPTGPMSSTTRATMEAKRAEMKEKIDAKKESVREKLDGAKAKAQEKFNESVQTSVGNIIDRLEKHTEKLDELADRIDARIKEHEGDGKDMSVSIGLLSAARTDIATTQDKVAAVGTTLAAALSATTPKSEVPKIRAAVKATEDALKKAKESLQKTLESVKTESTLVVEPSFTN